MVVGVWALGVGQQYYTKLFSGDAQRSISILLFDFDVNIVTADFDRVRTGRLAGRHCEGSTRADIKLRPVSRASDLHAAERPFGKRSVVVCANIVEGVKLAIDMKQRDHRIAHGQGNLARVGNVGDGGNSYKFRHQCSGQKVAIQNRKFILNRRTQR